MTIYEEIASERWRQDQVHGGPVRDDAHEPNDWVALICHFGVRTVCRDPLNRHQIKAFQAQMVKVAALAVAAIEWCDRRIAKIDEMSRKTMDQL